jgi:hypothetical protein
MMIIEIDGFFTHALLTGKKCSKKQLKQMYVKAKELNSDPGDFPSIISRLYHFEQIPYREDIKKHVN